MERPPPRTGRPGADRPFRTGQYLGDRRPQEAQGGNARRARLPGQLDQPPQQLLFPEPQQARVRRRRSRFRLHGGLQPRALPQRRCAQGPGPAPHHHEPVRDGLWRPRSPDPRDLAASGRDLRRGTGQYRLPAGKGRWRNPDHPCADGRAVGADREDRPQ